TVHPEVTRPLRRVDSRLQDRRAHDLQLRIRGLVDRSEPPRQRRVQGGQEARMGFQEPPRDERAGNRASDSPQVSQGLEADLNADLNNESKSRETNPSAPHGVRLFLTRPVRRDETRRPSRARVIAEFPTSLFRPRHPSDLRGALFELSWGEETERRTATGREVPPHPRRPGRSAD